MKSISSVLPLSIVIICCCCFIIVKSEECFDGPHTHKQSIDEVPRDISDRVYEYSEFLRQNRVLSSHTPPPTHLEFSEDGTFKIAVFTDLHYGEGEDEVWGPIQDINSTHAMKSYLESEYPDFVVFNGDQITGNNILYNATTYWNELLQPVLEYQTPWGIIFGNHDDLSAGPGETRADLMAFDSSYEYSFSRAGPDTIHGVSNYYLPIYEYNNTSIPRTILYFFDSGGGNEQPSQIFPDQIDWYVNTSNSLQEQYGTIIPSIAFFHIPLPENMKAWDEVQCSGYKNESVVCQDIDTGTFSAFVQQGDVKLTVSGHNHKNDYCCPYQGINLCYARHSGYGGYGPHAPWIQGTRILELNITDDTWDINTWIRLEDKTKLDNPPLHTPCDSNGCGQLFCGTDI